MRPLRILAALAVLLLAMPAAASFDVELGAESSYGWDNTTCTFTGTGLNGRTVPHCLANAAGTFMLRHFTRVLSGAALFQVQEVRFINRTGTGGTSVVDFKIKCTALVEGTAGAVTFGTAANVSRALTGVSTCDGTGEYCKTVTPSSATAVWNDNTGADCASTTCNNYDLVCQVSYDGTVANTVDDLDITSIKLTLSP